MLALVKCHNVHPAGLLIVLWQLWCVKWNGTLRLYL